jgi:LAO/AO transport system ATPase
MLDLLFERFRRGDRRALAQLLTFASRGEHLEDILDRLGPPAKSSRVVAFTGSAGVGKSTLIGRLIEFLRKQQVTVAVLACDPQSPLSGGALLGDRIRMPSDPDEGVYIRSLAAASGQGALAGHLDALIRLVEAFGFDNVFVETVGAGQGDTDVRDLADAVVLLFQPESGDDIQGEKAGLLEIADVVAVHKADLPGADETQGQLQMVLNLSAHTANVPVLQVSGRTGAGIEELWNAIQACPLRRNQLSAGSRALLRLVRENLAARLARAEAERDPAWLEIVERWRAGVLRRQDAIAAAWNYLIVSRR